MGQGRGRWEPLSLKTTFLPKPSGLSRKEVPGDGDEGEVEAR